MSNESPQIVQRLWNFCDVLRDDGVSYGDYVEQLTYRFSKVELGGLHTMSLYLTRNCAECYLH
jgi:hypothetical protein